MVGLGHFCYKRAIPLLLSDKTDEFFTSPEKNLHDSCRKSILLLQDALSAFIFLYLQVITRRTLKGIFPKQLRFVSQICSIVGTNGMTTILLSTICVTGGNTVPT